MIPPTWYPFPGRIPAASSSRQWSIADSQIKGTFATLAPGDVGIPFSLTVNVGKHPPRVTDEYAGRRHRHRHLRQRGRNLGRHRLRHCRRARRQRRLQRGHLDLPQNETNTIVAFQGEIGDWEQWSNSAQWNDFNGLDQWTNTELTEIPPEITGNPFSITEQIGNSHELNGVVFEGFWDAVLPNAFLVDMGINDPSTLTSAGISASVGTGTVTVTPGPTSTEISITGITFSRRIVHIKRGTITPAAPLYLRTRRASAKVAVLGFHAAKPRGSFVRSYQGRCWAKHRTTRFGTARRSPLKVSSLVRGVSYMCQVRAKAVVGYGPWSRSRKLAA